MVMNGIIDLDTHVSVLQDLVTKANIMRPQNLSLIRSTLRAGVHSPSRGFPLDSYSRSETKIRYSYNTTLHDIWPVTCDMLTTLVQICYIGMQWQLWSIDGRLKITVHETAGDLQFNKQEPTATPHEDRV
jgi:hypothetical protein